jgi:hypothetical protein
MSSVSIDVYDYYKDLELFSSLEKVWHYGIPAFGRIAGVSGISRAAS